MIPKERILKAIPDSGGYITTIAERVGCNRGTISERAEKDSEIKIAIEDERYGQKDFAEGQLQKAIKAENITAIIFYLKTQCKGRGYVEKQEVDYTQMLPSGFNIMIDGKPDPRHTRKRTAKNDKKQ